MTITDYQLEISVPNPTKLTNEEMAERIYSEYQAEWDASTEGNRPEMTRDIIIQKYLKIVEENPEPKPTKDKLEEALVTHFHSYLEPQNFEINYRLVRT
ncbi:MAG: hypothetical protein WA941_11440 [Nitrososphaeraceae archaeon]